MASKNVVVIDPDLYMKRMLKYQERHSGWHIFRAVYTALYLFIVAVVLITANYSVQTLVGISLLVLALMIIVYGFVASLHLKLMEKYG
ncbi:MAG: hypothetical protein M1122_02480 [Candidatus Marsarchaeota archaeon]|jgi:hypothetical protein|nr:hypothetical protein [Candidatus Marsarchaeota archaeon]